MSITININKICVNFIYQSEVGFIKFIKPTSDCVTKNVTQSNYLNQFFLEFLIKGVIINNLVISQLKNITLNKKLFKSKYKNDEISILFLKKFPLIL